MIAYHLRQSFRPGEITPEEANRLGCELARRFTKANHAFIVCTHIDKAHIHNHIIWNSTALDESRKFRNFWGSTRAIRRLNDTICIQNGYSIVENPKAKGKSYDKWLGDQKKPSHRERICFAIDDALAKNPESFDALLELLHQAGYEIKQGRIYCTAHFVKCAIILLAIFYRKSESEILRYGMPCFRTYCIVCHAPPFLRLTQKIIRLERPAISRLRIW